MQNSSKRVLGGLTRTKGGRQPAKFVPKTWKERLNEQSNDTVESSNKWKVLWFCTARHRVPLQTISARLVRLSGGARTSFDLGWSLIKAKSIDKIDILLIWVW